MTITLNQVHFAYEDNASKKVLSIPQWQVESSDHVLIHGPSGVGKSTLLNLLCGLQRPQSGSVEVLGQRLDTMSRGQLDRFRANNVGHIAQQLDLIPYLSALDNILLASRFANRDAKREAPDRARQLLIYMDIPPTDWQRSVSHLSVGQQQRVAIARALINQPPVIIADEPSSSLDPINRDGFITLLMNAVSEKPVTLVCVSHDMAIAPHFKQVVAFEDIHRPETMT